MCGPPKVEVDGVADGRLAVREAHPLHRACLARNIRQPYPQVCASVQRKNASSLLQVGGDLLALRGLAAPVQTWLSASKRAQALKPGRALGPDIPVCPPVPSKTRKRPREAPAAHTGRS